MLTEAILIALMGGAVGLLGSVVLLRWLSRWQPMALHRATPSGPTAFACIPIKTRSC